MNADLRNCRLYGFIDTTYLAGRDLAKVARKLIEGGADILQLRAKTQDPGKVTTMATQILSVTRPAGLPLIIDDYPEIVERVGAEGVHLGQEDLQTQAFATVRARLGRQKIIGISTHSLEQALEAERSGADYIGLGPIFPTGTKPGRPAVGLELITQVVERIKIPIVCIGGINLGNVRQIKNAGASWIAVVSAILCADNPAETAREFKLIMEQK